MGTIRLTAGSPNSTATVTTTAARAGNSMVFVSYMLPSGTPGVIFVRDSDISNGSFIIKSNSTTDTSYVNWWVISHSPY